ncbi:MAG: AsmA family protein [Candidatus Nanoarchaeia archaeon]
MRKFFKWFFIFISIFVILILIATVALPFLLPLDKIKDIAAQKLSEVLKREVKLGKISFNILKGFKLEDLYIGNREGFAKKPFVSAGSIELRYDLFSILKGKFNIKKIVLVNPKILVEKDKKGQFNFSDLIPQSKKEEKKEEKKAEKKKAPVDFLISEFSILNGELIYLDYSMEEVRESGFKNLNLDLSGITLKPMNPLSLNLKFDAIYQGKPMPAGLSGIVLFDLDKQILVLKNLKAMAAGDYLGIKGRISNYSTKNPSVDLELSSKKIKIDNFLNIFSGSKKEEPKKEKAPYGALTKTVDKATKGIPDGLKVSLNVSFDNIQFKELVLESLRSKIGLNKKILDINLDGTKAYNGKLSGNIKVDLNKSGLSYNISNLKISGFDAKPATNGFVESFMKDSEISKDLINKIEGNLFLEINGGGQGVEIPDIIKNLKGEGIFTLKDGKIKKLKSLEGIADKINIQGLKEDMELKEFKCLFGIKNSVFTISDLYAHNGDKSDLKLYFRGSANLEKLTFVPGNLLTLKVSPRIMPRELDVFKDKTGWGIFEFEFTGSLKKPLPIPKFEKPVEKIKEKIGEEIENKKKEEEERLKKEVEQKVEETKEKLKKEGEEKLKELIKF